MADSVRDVLPQTVGVIEDGLARGLQRGFQLFVWHAGRTVADAGFGESRPGVAMTPETITLWMSSGKPLTAVAIARLAERGWLSFDDRVSRHIPEFGQNGKEAVTVRQLLTHTGGFRNVETGWHDVSWDESIARVCAAPLESDWTPGARAGYHVASSWFILGEIIRRLDGRPFSQFVREEICEPLAMHDTWNGMPGDVYERYGERIGWMYAREQEGLQPPAGVLRQRCTAPSPGGNTRGPIRELGRFYRMLLNGGELDGVRILLSETVAELTRQQREGMFDETFRHTLDFGLGFIVDSNRYGPETVPYTFGRHCSPRTFGHGGAQSSIGFADPEHELVVAWAANGMIGEPQHQRRNRAVNEAIYADLRVGSG